jgi:hypothetical protein
MSLKFTKFTKNNNHNKKKTRKDYKKTKKKIIYGGAKSGPPKTGSGRKTGVLKSFSLKTQPAQKEEPQQQKEKPAHVGAKIWNTFSKSLSSFGMGTIGTRYKQYKKSTSSTGPQGTKSSNGPIKTKTKAYNQIAELIGKKNKGEPPETGPLQEKLPGPAAESTGPPKLDPPPSGLLKTPGASSELTGKLKTPGSSTVPELTTLKQETASTTLKQETALTTPQVLKPEQIVLKDPKPVEPTSLSPPPRSPRGAAPPAPAPPPALIVPKIDETYIPKNEFEQKLQNVKINLKKAEIPLPKPLELPLTPAQTVVLKPVPAKTPSENQKPVETIPRSVPNITPKETGSTTFGSSNPGSKNSFVTRATQNINSGKFTKRSKNTGNVLRQEKEKVIVGKLAIPSIFTKNTKKNTKPVPVG